MPTELRLSEQPLLLLLVPHEQFTQPKIPGLVFANTDVYDMQHACCTGSHRFGNQERPNDWPLVQA